MISKDDMNIEASNIQIKTIGAGYEKVGDSFIKINSISKLNLGSKDETTNIEEGRYSKTVDRGKMMGYQAGKAYATAKLSDFISKGAGTESLLKGDFVLNYGIVDNSLNTTMYGKIADQTLSMILDNTINPSIENEPVTSNDSIFNMQPIKIINTKTIDTKLIGDVNVLH